MAVYLIIRRHRSGNWWQLGGRTALEAAQSECRGLPGEPQVWRQAAAAPVLGDARIWSTETPESLEWFEIEEVLTDAEP